MAVFGYKAPASARVNRPTWKEALRSIFGRWRNEAGKTNLALPENRKKA